MMESEEDGVSHRYRYANSQVIGGKGHPTLFGFAPALDFGPFPDGGGYPIGLLQRVYRLCHVQDPEEVLHVCSGSMLTGIRVDRRINLRPTIVADALHLPFLDASFRVVLADPPYSREYARELYGTAEHYPGPVLLARECARVVRPGGYLGFLHVLVPYTPPEFETLGVWGVTQGSGYRVRAFTLFRRAGGDLFP